MSELPKVPNLDPDLFANPPDLPPNPFGFPSGIDLTKKTSFPPPPPPDVAAPQASSGASHEHPSPPPLDSLEEILEHTSGLTLNVSRVEETLLAVQTAIVELRHDCLAGFNSLPAAATAPTNSLQADVRKDSLGERLDVLEVQSHQTQGRQNLFLVLALIQSVLLLVLLFSSWMAGGPRTPSTELPPPGPTPAHVEMSRPSNTDLSPIPTLPDDDKRLGKKGKKKRIMTK